MRRKIFIPSFSFLILVASQNIFAHNENTGFEQREVEREAASEKKDSDTWDDFMASVKEQEVTKAKADKHADKEVDKKTENDKPASQ